MARLFEHKKFTYLQVNHSKNFVNSDNSAYTLLIEGLWLAMKRKLWKHGTNRGNTETTFEKIQKELYKKNSKIIYLLKYLLILGNFNKSILQKLNCRGEG